MSAESVRRPGMVALCKIPPGSKVAWWREWFVVAAPDAPPFMVHGLTGERREIELQPFGKAGAPLAVK